MKISKLKEKLEEFDGDKEVRLVIFAESENGETHYFVSKKEIVLKQGPYISNKDEEVISITSIADAEGHFVG